MSWGKGIFITFVVYTIALAFLVYKTTEVTSEMVTDNYYEKEKEYNAIYIGKTNVLNLEIKPRVEANNQGIVITYPTETISENTSGEVYFYSINKVSNDKLYTLKLDSNFTQTFDKGMLTSGNYTVQLKWTSDSMHYFFDKNIYIP